MNRLCKDLSLHFHRPGKAPSWSSLLDKIFYSVAVEGLEHFISTHARKCSFSQKAFTLFELCVLIAVVGVLSAIAIPSYLSWKPGYEFRSAVSVIQRELNRAKMRAVEIRRQSRVEVCGSDYQVIDGDRVMASNWNVPGTEYAPSCPMTNEELAAFNAAGRRVAQGNVVAHNQVTLIAGRVDPTFSPRGTAFPSSFTIHHTNGDSAKVAINIVGRIRIAWQ